LFFGNSIPERTFAMLAADAEELAATFPPILPPLPGDSSS